VEIKKVGAWSAAKVMGATYALIGQIFGIFVALAALLGVLGAAAANSGGLTETIGFGIGGGLIGSSCCPSSTGSWG